MNVFGGDFLEEMKDRFEIDLVRATTIESAASPELERRVSPPVRVGRESQNEPTYRS